MCALKINFQDKDGNAGEYVNFNPPTFLTKIKVQLKLNFWKDQTTRETEGALPYNDELAGGRTERIVGFDCIEEFNYDLADKTKNVFEQGYAYLKTLAKYAGAIDA